MLGSSVRNRFRSSGLWLIRHIPKLQHFFYALCREAFAALPVLPTAKRCVPDFPAVDVLANNKLRISGSFELACCCWVDPPDFVHWANSFWLM